GSTRPAGADQWAMSVRWARSRSARPISYRSARGRAGRRSEVKPSSGFITRSLSGAAIGAHPYLSGGRGRTLSSVDQVEVVRTPASWVVVGLDNGGTCNNATVLDATGQFLVDHLV